jgi:hypothetical protein
MTRLPARPVALMASAVLLGTLGAVGVVPEARALTRVVSNCNDAGAGSLRAAANAATSGDTIDLRALACNRIVLTSGEIRLPDQFITIIGAGESRITIDGNHASRVFNHSPTSAAPWPLNNNATLRLVRLTVANGLHEQDNGAAGGCVYGRTHVRLEYAQVHHCVVRATAPGIGGISVGGGVFAGGKAVLFHAAVFENQALGDSHGSTAGGVNAGDILHVSYSTIRDNFVDGEAGGGAGLSLFLDRSTVRNNTALLIGGVTSYNGPATINKSTISGNFADHHGAMGSLGGGATHAVLIADSTISGNRTLRSPAGFGLDGRGSTPILVLNSTISDNIADAPFLGNEPVGGVSVLGPARFRSTIIADNYVGTEAQDLWAQIAFGARVLGDDNLIETSNAPLPVDTIQADPMLGPLANNGGRTQTQALTLGSPAIDAGNNAHNYQFDQRGEGFPRVVNGRADIGAYER